MDFLLMLFQIYATGDEDKRKEAVKIPARIHVYTTFSCPLLPNTLHSTSVGSEVVRGELTFASLFVTVTFVRVGVPGVHLSVAS